MGDREAREGEEIRYRVEPASAADRGQHTGRDADGGREEHREERELQRDREPRDDDLGYQQSTPGRATEVALQDERGPSRVLDRHRIVEAVLRPDLRVDRGVVPLP